MTVLQRQSFLILGAAAEVIGGPRMGVDAGIVRVGDQYMAIAEDPIFPGPTTSPEDFGWITVHIGASDVAVMGIKPQFMTYTLCCHLEPVRTISAAW